jgi:TetR/AcrR family transcriptional regulator, mexJK operon transcriptional repressor
MTSHTKLRGETSRGDSKRQAILTAAEAVFLRDGFAAANMDEIAASAGASKQTVYAHFGTKTELFRAAIGAMAEAPGTRAQELAPEDVEPGELESFLADYAERQLTAALSSQAVQLSRLVIGETARFPDLAAALHELGPQRSISGLTREINRLVRQGLLEAADPRATAIDFYWLIVGEPINRAMLLGDEAIPSARSIRAHAEHVAGVFVRAYGRRGTR